MKTNNNMLMSNVMSHHMGCDDKVDGSHDGHSSGPMMRQICLDCSQGYISLRL